jgi:hypothetical protein
MGAYLTNKFPNGMKVFQIPLQWFRDVTNFINGVAGGNCVEVARPQSLAEGVPVLIQIDDEELEKKVAEAVSETSIDSDNLGEGTGADQEPTALSTGTQASEANPSDTSGITTLTQTFWTADSGKPCKVLIFTKLRKSSGAYATTQYLFGRYMEISPNGRVMAIGKEEVCYEVIRA